MAQQVVTTNKKSQSNGPDYKAMLDEAASRKESPPHEEEQSPSIIDKVSQYVPAVGKVLGKQEKKLEGGPSSADTNKPGPPDRPIHDTQIEEFIKGQHQSKKVVGIEEPTQE
ncbi:hypothetical protein N657DRAFT_687792 [Parathielavia appendiculata]|uniref:Uncharacterized protein n=1 Tax=Parathielavia appendiculata TaxID=2587402 RepID=A0AAN6U7Q5_9PEZI|nr:hypothetical protein N657DRAFT_687792 [Parathielavia appendiculata]